MRGWDPRTKQAITYTATAADLPGRPGGGTSGPEAAEKKLGRQGGHRRRRAGAEPGGGARARHEPAARARLRVHHRQRAGDRPARPAARRQRRSRRPRERFSGRYYVKKVEHTIGNSGYITQFDVRRVLRRGRQVSADAALADHRPALLRRRRGHRRRRRRPGGRGPRQASSFPWFDDEMVSEWCRVAQPYAGNGYGVFLVPEVGDEVLVAFIHGDMRLPIVLGGLYNGQDKPPTSRQDDTDQKLIRTKAGHELLFDDSDGTERVTLETAGGHALDLDDAGRERRSRPAAGTRSRSTTTAGRSRSRRARARRSPSTATRARSRSPARP